MHRTEWYCFDIGGETMLAAERHGDSVCAAIGDNTLADCAALLSQGLELRRVERDGNLTPSTSDLIDLIAASHDLS